MTNSGPAPRHHLLLTGQPRPQPSHSGSPLEAEGQVEHSFRQAGRTNSLPGSAICFGSFRLLPDLRLLLVGNKPVRLGSRALEILIALVERPCDLISKEELMARVWPNTFVEPANLTVHIAALRRTLGDGRGSNRFLINIPGRGYRFVAPVRISEQLELSAPTPPGIEQVHNLPATVARLIGREGAVSGLSAQLSRLRFLTIVGPGGIGKTSAAIAVAERLVETHEHGVRLIDLAPLGDSSLVPSAVAATLGLEIYAEEQLPELIGALRDKQMLLVLDNCEHVVASVAGLVGAVLRGAPNVRILATSREPLRTEGEHLYRLPPLASPPASSQVTAREALGFPAIQLFVAHVASVLGEFELSDRDALNVADICRRLDGLPLAIEIAAARVAAFGVRGVAACRDDGLQLLTSNRRTGLARHLSLAANLDWSYALLSDAAQIALRRVAIFVGAFTLRAAAAVASDEILGESEMVNLVAELVAKSLVMAYGHDTEPWFYLLVTTRTYALTKLVESGEADALARRHAEYLQNTATENASGGSPLDISVPQLRSIDTPEGGWPA
jgi:predicted ATPase/DNA-binding winged helix-turn-helix (wHTH) protein